MSDVRSINGIVSSPMLSSASANGITVTLSVNSVSVATVSTFPKSDSIVRTILTKDTLAAMKTAQENRFQLPDSPDSSLTFSVNDATFTMRGYSVSPQITSRKDAFDQGFSIVGVDAMFDAIDMSIYVFSESFESDNRGDMPALRSIFDKEGSADAGNFAKLLKSIMQTLVGYYPQIANERETKSATKRKVIAAQHQLNLKLLPAWYDLLDRSDVVFSEWAAVFSTVPGLVDFLIERIKASLRNPGGFWNVLLSLLSEFRVAYVPSLTGSGKLIKLSDKMKESGKSFELQATSFNLSDGSVRLVPLAGVIVVGDTPWAMQPTETLTGDASAGLLAAYPSSFGNGYVLTIPAPIWVQSGSKTMINSLSIGGEDTEDVDPMTVDATATASTAKVKNAERNKKTEQMAVGLLGEYAKAVYNEVRYADAKVKVTLPAVPGGLEPGERRTFTTPDGGSFTAFVASITYTMTLAADQLMVSTSADLTHVKF